MPLAIDSSPISSVPRPIHAWIEGSPDPVRVSRYMNEFASRHRSSFDSLASDNERARWLPVIFGCSAFLSEEILRQPEWLAQITDFHQQLSTEDYKERLADFLQKRVVLKPAALDLAMFRRHELLRIVLRDRMGIASLAAVTDEISSLADAILGCALAAVTKDVEARHGRPLTESGSPTGFTVLALGKLGGRELNYSSDIDLMFLYGENGETTGAQVITNKEFFKKVANQFTNLLSTYTAAGVCYRVDLRLRPEGTLGEVCLSLPAAKDYYSKRARDWELQMLIKARVTAGDEALGQSLLDFVEPSIYSTTLDFSTIETMSVTRERITEKLARKRFNKEVIDVKLARGGIRDIEFLVQCLQRLHGAREARVRHGGHAARFGAASRSRFALHHRIFAPGGCLRISAPLGAFTPVGRRPANPYASHEPGGFRATGAPHEHCARSAPASTGITTELLKQLNQRLENVQVIYERIVHAQRPLQYSALSSSHASGNHEPALEERGEVDVAGEVLDALAKTGAALCRATAAAGLVSFRARLACVSFHLTARATTACLCSTAIPHSPIGCSKSSS